MAKMGVNMKLTIDEAQRPRLRALLTEVLGASLQQPKPDLEVYLLEDGYSIGAYFVEKGEALDEAAHRKAPWLEILVADPTAVTRELDRLEIERIDYWDKAHAYYQMPGGPVFRLASIPS